MNINNLNFKTMYTVGMISKDSIKTESYTDLKEAFASFKCWRNCIMNNNVVNKRVTLSSRDEAEEIIFIKDIFHVKYGDSITTFISKNS